ncbi:MAG: sugar phosphate isomerase/epimerase [Verrucomicrobiales bacterium]|jgi:sugar phosphate isomerase/epimerase|nr:sugar phosphate isomerase/epimerase [Verrucomicrobiales bacterium]
MATPGKIKPGLVSVSFRKLNPPQLVQLCKKASLRGIEWGGDLHVPHGDFEMARRVGELTRDSGLEVAAYGSYYRVGSSERDGLAFEKVLETAIHLQAPLIRVWAGVKASADADEAYVNWVIEESQRIAALAQQAGVKVAYEYHADTLTDSLLSTVTLNEQARHPNLFFLWQPANGKAVAYNLQTLNTVLPRLQNVHVFHWWPDASVRHPLTTGEKDWQEYFKVLHNDDAERYALLEFVKGDEPEQLLQDAATLHRLLFVAQSGNG